MSLLKTSFVGVEKSVASALVLGVLVSFVPFTTLPSVAHADEEASITVIATKIVCTDESELPNWGTSVDGFITEATATDWVATHESCSFQSGWSFEWGNQEAVDPGGSFIGAAGAGFTTFGVTDVNGVVSTTIPLSMLGEGTEFRLREVLQEGFIPFTFDGSDDDTVSAEFYCASDVLHYDNFDFIHYPEADATYYCVGWNVPVETEEPPVLGCMDAEALNFNPLATVDDASCTYQPPTDLCDNLEGTQESVPEGYTEDEGVCTQNQTPPPPPQDLPECGDGIDNDGDGSIDFNGSPNDTSCSDAQDDSEGDVGGWVPTSGGGSGGGGSVLGAATGPVGQVLGESCGLYMDQYLRRGNPKNNADQVLKLQAFLIKHGFGTFTPTGIFGSATEEAVKKFQTQHADHVLKPWSLPAPTGLVYLTTLHQINMIECPALTLTLPALVPWSQNPAAR